MRHLLFALAAALLALAACSEDPQRLESAVEPGFRTDGWPEQMRARTLNQNESTRIGQ